MMSNKSLSIDKMKPFYSMEETCELFDMDQETIFIKMEEANLRTTESPDGTICLSKDTLCRLNKKVYWDDRPKEMKKEFSDPNSIFSPDKSGYMTTNGMLCFWYFPIHGSTQHPRVSE